MVGVQKTATKQLLERFFDSNIFSLFGGTNRTPTRVVGKPGTAVFGGYPIQTDTDPELVGRRRYKTFGDILANTSIVSAGVRYYLNLISKAKWKVVPADDSSAAIEMQEFVEDVMNDMQTPWHRITRRAAMYKFYGFGIQEWTAKRLDDGRFGMLDIAPRSQLTIQRWVMNEDGSVFGVIQRNPQNQQEIFIPREKVIYMIDDSLNDSPEGLGLFRHLVPHAKRLQRYEQLEGFGFETNLRGVPIARAPLTQLQQMVTNGTIKQEDVDRLVKPLQDFIQNHIKSPELGMVLDSSPYQAEDEAARPINKNQWDIDLLNTDGDIGQEEVSDAIQRVTYELARILGVEHILLGSTGSGSLAMSQDKSLNFFLLVDSALTEIKETYQNDFLDTLWGLNGFDDELKPELQPEAVQFRDIEQITVALRDMASSGAILAPDDPAINEVRELLGLSPQSESLMDDLDESLTGNRNPPNAGTGDDDELPDASGTGDEE